MSGPGSADPSHGVLPAADAIVVAAGRSTRMGGTDKLLAPIGGRPLLAWTVAALKAVPEIERIVVVTAPEHVATLRAADWLRADPRDVVAGGDRRDASVAAGVAALGDTGGDDDRVLLVHDGARPMVTPDLVRSVIHATALHGAAIPILPIAETVKRVEGELVGATVDRDGLGMAQTPQGVRRGVLREAYARFPPGGERAWTDEAALLEACRIPVHVVPGDPSNLKVTRPADLRRAEAALAATRPGRVGIGHDSHPFGPGEPLALGGVTIEGAPRLHGHSDGDVAIHALCDAILGAAGLGDLGRIFPAGPSTPAGIAGAELLADVADRATAAGWRVGNADITIVAARPRLASHLDPMRAAIAGLLGVDATAVNVKASTGNLAGDEGAGRSISALAVVMLETVG